MASKGIGTTRAERRRLFRLNYFHPCDQVSGWAQKISFGLFRQTGGQNTMLNTAMLNSAMLKKWGIALALTLTVSGVSWGQYRQSSGRSYGNVVQSYQPQWAASLVAQPRHDFGNVARGSEQVHVFEFTNPLKEDIVISGQRVSCKCAEPTVLTPVVKPGEKGQIKVRFNTLAFVGQRHSRITLSVARPQNTELYLDIDGFVRQDIVVTPGHADFLNRVAGQTAECTLKIAYAGDPGWQILKAECSNPNIVIDLQELARRNGRIDYQMQVRVNETQSAGNLSSQIVVHTNDRNQKQFPISVNGYFKPLIEAQSVVDVGQLETGGTITKRLVLKAGEDFVITSATSNSDRIKIKVDDQRKKLHVVELTVTPDGEGKLADQLSIVTDMQDLPIQVQVVGEVLPTIRTNSQDPAGKQSGDRQPDPKQR